MLVVIGISQHPCELYIWFAFRKFCYIILGSSELCTTMAIMLLLTISVNRRWVAARTAGGGLVAIAPFDTSTHPFLVNFSSSRWHSFAQFTLAKIASSSRYWKTPLFFGILILMVLVCKKAKVQGVLMHISNLAYIYMTFYNYHALYGIIKT